MKRNHLTSSLILMLLLFALPACGGDDEASTDTGAGTETVQEGQVSEATAIPATAVAQEEPTAPPPTPVLEVIAETAEQEATATVSPTATAISGSATHTVLEREWLHQIARCYGTSPNDVVSANHLPHPGWIMAGEVWTIPNLGSVGPVLGPPCIIYYSVQQGDTLYSISRAYNVPVDVLTFVNYGCYGYNAHYDYGYYPPVAVPYGDGGLYYYEYYYDYGGYGYLGGCHYYSYPWLYIGELLVIPVNSENMHMR